MTNELKERPILFSAPMVRAILDGRKTQTRRVVKLSDKDLHDDSAYLNGGSAAVALGHGVGGIVEWREQDGQWIGLSGFTTVANIPCPYGKVGDRLWVRESISHIKVGPVSGQPTQLYGYTADIPAGKSSANPYKCEYLFAADGEPNLPKRSVPSIHMPRWASRIDLEITGNRVERLQDISEADAIAEGVTADIHGPNGFKDLWESINGAGSWEANPFVWLVEFKRIKP